MKDKGPKVFVAGLIALGGWYVFFSGPGAPVPERCQAETWMAESIRDQRITPPPGCPNPVREDYELPGP